MKFRPCVLENRTFSAVVGFVLSINNRKENAGFSRSESFLSLIYCCCWYYIYNNGSRRSDVGRFRREQIYRCFNVRTLS